MRFTDNVNSKKCISLILVSVLLLLCLSSCKSAKQVVSLSVGEAQEKLRELEGISVELSACAGFRGLFEVENEGTAFADYLRREKIAETMEQATHIVWATGGGLMPDA